MENGIFHTRGKYCSTRQKPNYYNNFSPEIAAIYFHYVAIKKNYIKRTLESCRKMALR